MGKELGTVEKEAMEKIANTIMGKLEADLKEIDFKNIGDETLFILRVQGLKKLSPQESLNFSLALQANFKSRNINKKTMDKVLIMLAPWNMDVERKEISLKQLTDIAASRGFKLIPDDKMDVMLLDPDKMTKAHLKELRDEWMRYDSQAKARIAQLRKWIDRGELYKVGDKDIAGKIVLLPLVSMVEEPAPEKEWYKSDCEGCGEKVWIAPINKKRIERGAKAYCVKCGYRRTAK